MPVVTDVDSGPAVICEDYEHRHKSLEEGIKIWPVIVLQEIFIEILRELVCKELHANEKEAKQKQKDQQRNVCYIFKSMDDDS